MNEIVRIFVGFLVLAGLFWIIESLWPEDRTQPKWRGDSLTDLAYWFFNGLITKFVTTLVIVIAIALTIYAIPRPGATFITALPGWVQMLAVLLLGDLIAYWVHRLTHRVPALWRIHAVHHSPIRLDWLAAGRVHPLDSILHKVAAVVPLYLIGFSPGVLAAYAPFLAVYPIFLHANVRWNLGPLSYLIASPGFHRWHHSSDKEALDKNFSGLFPLFDYLFGTAYFPRDRRPQKYGLNHEIMPRGLFRQLVYPFRKRGY